LEAFRASLLRREFDRHGGQMEWFPLFQRTEAEGPVEPVSMSELSALILDRMVDWPELRQRRRANYQFLTGELHGLALFPELPPDVVPLGCPVRLPERDKVRERLIKQNIYPPIHWHLAGTVPESFVASHRLAADILTLPCDQRYAFDDMERIVDGVLFALA
jgi:dTDP-4-amino-4,6-dideoxygalactose transaminase